MIEIFFKNWKTIFIVIEIFFFGFHGKKGRVGVGEINLAEKMIRNHFKNWFIFGISNAVQMDQGIVKLEKKNEAHSSYSKFMTNFEEIDLVILSSINL